MDHYNGNWDSTSFNGFPGGYVSVPGAGNFILAALGNTNINMPGANSAQVYPNNIQSIVYWGPQMEAPIPEPGQTAYFPRVNPNNLPGIIQWGQERVIYDPPVGQFILNVGEPGGLNTGSN